VRMNAPRSGCPINLTLEALGDRWSLIIIPSDSQVLDRSARQAYGRDSKTDWTIDVGEYLKTLPRNEIVAARLRKQYAQARMAAEADEQRQNGQHVPVTRRAPSRRPTGDEPFPAFSDLLINTVGERCGRR
jgi:hypothetical protein